MIGRNNPKSRSTGNKGKTTRRATTPASANKPPVALPPPPGGFKTKRVTKGKKPTTSTDTPPSAPFAAPSTPQAGTPTLTQKSQLSAYKGPPPLVTPKGKAKRTSQEKASPEKKEEKRKSTCRQRKRNDKTEEPMVVVKGCKSRTKKRGGSGSHENSTSSKEQSDVVRDEKSNMVGNLKDPHSRAKTASTRRISAESIRLEKMPESSQLNQSVRAMKTKMQTAAAMKPSAEVPEKESLPSELFNENGEPTWLNFIDDPVQNTELVRLLASSNMEIDVKEWADVATELAEERLDSGIIMDRAEQETLDPYADMEQMQQNDECLSLATVNYLTAKTINLLSYPSVRRYIERREGRTRQPRRTQMDTTQKASAEKASEELKTCYNGDTTFDLRRNVYYSYDRRNPFASAQAFTKKKKGSGSKTSETTEGR